MTPIFRFIGAILSVYMVLIFVRILLTWFSGPTGDSRAITLLHKATDPYLNWFRRFPFLKTGRIDFSPIAGVLVLVIALNIVNQLSVYGRITIGLILAIAVDAVGSAFFFIVGFFLLLTIIRTIAVFIGTSSMHQFWQTLDVIINPILAFIQRTLMRDREVTYRNGLALSSVALLGTFLIGRIILAWLVSMLGSLPI